MMRSVKYRNTNNTDHIVSLLHFNIYEHHRKRGGIGEWFNLYEDDANTLMIKVNNKGGAVHMVLEDFIRILIFRQMSDVRISLNSFRLHSFSICV